MATGSLRDLRTFAAGFSRWLRHRRGVEAPPVASVAHASDGLSNETVLVGLGSAAGGDGERLVVRMPPLTPSFPSYDLAMQAAVQRAVALAGVPAPAPCEVEDDESWVGARFLVMPHLSGHVPGIVPSFDPWVTDATPGHQRQLHDAFVDTLAAIHAVPWRRAGLGAVLRGAEGPLATELGWWERYADWASGGEPSRALADALAWCRLHLPEDSTPPVLLWGDPRLGNLVVDPRRRVAGVLDWEMASLGPPGMDLGWYLALDEAMAALTGRPVPGFPPHAETVARYERRAGRPVTDLAFHLTFALTRAMAVSERQSRVRAGPGAWSRSPDPLAPLLAARLGAAGP